MNNINIEKIEQDLEYFKSVKYRIREEGFHYCFESYSNFEEITDEYFHDLRKEYLEKANELENYVHSKIQHLENIIQQNI
jgi:predicted ATP-binding protein involved in virulence